jgi:hypothetical protein
MYKIFGEAGMIACFGGARILDTPGFMAYEYARIGSK